MNVRPIKSQAILASLGMSLCACMAVVPEGAPTASTTQKVLSTNPQSVIESFAVEAPGVVQRSRVTQLQWTFNRELDFTSLIQNGDITQQLRLTHYALNTDTSLPEVRKLFADEFSYDVATRKLVWRSSLGPLEEGFYELRFAPGTFVKVFSAAALKPNETPPPAGAISSFFHVLPGDYDGSGQITGADLKLLDLKRGLTNPDDLALYDLDGDGLIGNSDLLVLQGRFGRLLEGQRVPPRVAKLNVQGGQMGRSRVDHWDIFFSADMGLEGSKNLKDVLEVRSLGSRGDPNDERLLDVTEAQLRYQRGQKKLSWRLDAFTGNTSSSLADGLYEIVLHSDLLRDPLGRTLKDPSLGGDLHLRFWVLRGDVNGDGTVDQADVDLLAGADLSQYDPSLDVDRDGRLSTSDITALSALVGNSVVH